ncbi:hypothetical protein J7400_17715 [Shimia sp. R9_2]|uniref:hypothetical protein n=1 Tax=Shimia sp. R9_2 TaxID=2821112 RepID=UPI001ADB2861|nr:hypothetical protein [Shimia sp. R9_2]MBO9398513.1 hypothetical protein [Shimia sp. R9_2]
MDSNLDCLRINVYGHFRISDRQGRDLTPVNEKSQAIIALLVTSEPSIKTRSWLQDKLWSTSDPERGAASLRQCLTKIRKSLGDKSSVLQSNRKSVWLDTEKITTDWRQETQTQERSEFLEGIDIRDSEFNHWLQIIRNKIGCANKDAEHNLLAVPHQAKKRWKIALICSENSSSAAFHLESEFVSLLCRNIGEQGDYEIGFDSSETSDPFVINVFVHATSIDDDRLGLRVSAHSAKNRRIMWNETITLVKPFGPIDKNLNLLGMAFRLQSALIKSISYNDDLGARQKNGNPQMGSFMSNVFSFDAEHLERAEYTLSSPPEGENPAIALGWRSQIAVIRLIERFADNEQATIEEGMSFAERAVEADPMNSIVLASASNAHAMLMDDEMAASELAKLAVMLNPSNPLAWWAYSNAALYLKDYEKARDAAQIGARMSAKSPLQFWCEFQVGLAALLLGDHEKAARSFETSAALSPKFRPPRRYLLALYSHRGNFCRARRMSEQLHKLEQGFTIDEFFRNEDYPISLARRAGLVCTDAITDLV